MYHQWMMYSCNMLFIGELALACSRIRTWNDQWKCEYIPLRNIARHCHPATRQALAFHVTCNATTSSWLWNGSVMSTCEFRNHYRSDPVQVQSTSHSRSARSTVPLCGSELLFWCGVSFVALRCFEAQRLHQYNPCILLGAQDPLKNSGSHIDASLSRQPLVKGERLVRYEVNAVIELDFLFAYTCACIERQKGVTLHKEATRKQRIQTTPKKQKHQKNTNIFFQTTLGGIQQSSVKNYCFFVFLFFCFFCFFGLLFFWTFAV